MAQYAKVRFPSPLPALDKEFDYLVPGGLEVKFGQYVKVQFGKAEKQKTGIVVGISSETEIKQPVEIAEVLSKNIFLTVSQHQLMEQVATRNCGTVGELLAQVVPKFMVRTDKSTSNFSNKDSSSKDAEGRKSFILCGPSENPAKRLRVRETLGIIESHLSNGRSVIVSVPDFRDLAEIEVSIREKNHGTELLVFSSEDAKSKYFKNYLTAQTKPNVILGLRTALFLPAYSLGAIVVLDEGDESHVEPSSPYWNSRDIALIRQKIDDCDLTFISSSPTSEIVRLVEVNYLEMKSLNGTPRIIRTTDNQTRLDDETYSLMTRTIQEGKPVLVQVSNRGMATSIACMSCSEIRKCQCGAGIWIDHKFRFRCRSCKRTGELPPCACGSTQTKTLRTGSSYVADWLAKNFGSERVIHSSGEERLRSIPRSGSIVIATPGAEPSVDGGYSLVILADAGSMLSAPRMRALEQSCLKWANAIQLSAQESVVIFVGISGPMVPFLRELDFWQIVRGDCLERRDLALPPFRRVATISSKNARALNLLREDLNKTLSWLQFISENDSSICLIFDYSKGAEVVATIKAVTESVSKKTRDKLPGERLFRVIMDDLNAL
ncbi:MAG: hypothetical protein ACKOFA_04000 [Rhodoluna sp.]